MLLPREAGEVLTTHVPRFERRKVRMATDLLLYGVQLAPELLDQPLGVGQVGLPRGRPVHGAPFARASSRVLCALAVGSTSVLAAMMKSFRWSPRILWVHQVTVTRPHSGAFVVWNAPPEDRTRRSHGQSLRPHDSPVNRNGGDHARL